MAEWKKVAYSMKFDLHIIGAIEKDSHNVNECCDKLFTNWLTTNNGPSPKTWKTLLVKIKEVDDLARASEEIEKELLKQNAYKMSFIIILFSSLVFDKNLTLHLDKIEKNFTNAHTKLMFCSNS